MELRQSTTQIIRFGPFVDSTDGVTPETGLTIAQADMQLSKDGGAFAQKSAAGNATHDVDGYYSTTLSATDTNTVANLKLQVTVSGALLSWDNFDIVTASYYDAKYSGTFNNLGGTAQTADHTAGIADIPNNAEFNARTLVAANYFDPAADAVANVTLVATTTALTNVINAASVVASISGNVDGSVASVTAAVTVGTMNANVISAASIAAAAMNGKGDWNIGKAGYALTTADWNVGKTGYTLTTQDWNTVAPLSASATRSALGLATANMDVQFAASVTATGFATPTNITAGTIANVANKVSADIDSINGVTITGDGSATPFDV